MFIYIPPEVVTAIVRITVIAMVTMATAYMANRIERKRKKQSDDS